MALWSAQIATGADSALPEDYFVNTLHFNGVGTFLASETDVSSIATDLAALWNTLPGTSNAREIRVKIYNLDDAKPRPIRAQAALRTGFFPASTIPREVALCLSYYADRNLPRNRGRLFIPAVLLGSSAGARPTLTQMNAALALHQQLSDLGGTDLEWSVFSRSDNQHKKVSNSWVDDEWDTMRSRGLKSTTRVTHAAEG